MTESSSAWVTPLKCSTTNWLGATTNDSGTPVTPKSMAALPLSLTITGQVPPERAKNALTVDGSSLNEMLTTTASPLALCSWENLMSSGCSTWQGTHHVAKKLTITHSPR